MIKSKQMDITGSWIGELVYLDEEGTELADKKKQFRLTLIGDDGEFTGESQDLDGFGVINTPASVSGFVEEGMISFVKLFQECYLINEKGEVFTNPGKEPREVNFSGYLNEETGWIEGDWHMLAGVKQVAFMFAERLITGTWKMKREG